MYALDEGIESFRVVEDVLYVYIGSHCHSNSATINAATAAAAGSQVRVLSTTSSSTRSSSVRVFHSEIFVKVRFTTTRGR